MYTFLENKIGLYEHFAKSEDLKIVLISFLCKTDFWEQTCCSS